MSKSLRFCQKYLTCALPARAIAETPVAEENTFAVAASGLAKVPLEATAAQVSDFVSDFASDSHALSLPAAPAQPSRPPSPLVQSLRSLVAEVSIVWLLFLGVFMVVVSSGVLAATQWQNFSAIGQYGILLAYTLAFAIASLWTGRQVNLRLTSRMLQFATLLLIPVNFWTMDGLRIGASLGGLVFSAIASLVITAILLVLLHPRNGLTAPDHFRLTVLNGVSLSWLHWGWGWAGMPLLATYAGTVGTALLLWMQSRQTKQEPGTSHRSISEPDSSEPDSSEPDSITSLLPNVVIILAALLLIGRAVLVAQVPLDQLGLALGLCGWIWGWLNRRSQQTVWVWVSLGLLGIGWLSALPADPPWQAIAISGLGLWLLIDRLFSHSSGRSQGSTLVAIFLVGLQGYGLLWRLVPPSLRQQLIELAMQIAGDRGLPLALVGVGLFPYLVLALGVTARLRQYRTTASEAFASVSLVWARQTEGLTLILGISLTLLSWDNLLVRSLNLTFSALTLLLVFRHRRSPLPLLYLTHLTALVSILCWIRLLFPGLDRLSEARILLVMMAIEWSLSSGTHYRRWRRSAWHVGLALAGCGYLFLFSRGLFDTALPNTAYENLVGLLIPLALVGLSRSPAFPQRQLAAWLSAAMLVAQLFLLNFPNAWCISFGVATVLMLVNTRTLHHVIAASLTIGFMLGCEATAIAVQADQMTATVGVNLFAANLWALWLLRDWLLHDWLRQRQAPLSDLYAVAANLWAIALCTLNLLLLTVYCILEPTWGMTVAAGLMMGAIAYRLWQQPTNLGFYGLAWSGQILVVALVNLTQSSIETAAIATLALGLLAQGAGDIWVSRSGQPYRSSGSVIPLLYAGLGWLLGHASFTATTGLFTLATVLIGIGVGRRLPRLKPLSVASILLASLAAYELLVYQLLQAQGGDPGDGMTLMAGLAAAIALIDRLTARWLLPYLRLTRSELKGIAHLHWALSSSLALLALPLSLSTMGTCLWLGIVSVMAGYALGMGRRSLVSALNTPSNVDVDLDVDLDVATDTAQDAWTYGGLLEAIATLTYALYRLVPDTPLLLSWAGAIASIVAVGLYFLPWQRWGWAIRPWQNMGLVLPALVIFLTGWVAAIQSLLMAAACYAWLAKSSRQIRLSYISILLLDWALLKYLDAQDWQSILGMGMVLGSSLLYVAQ
ncbi:MAG: hypothetical protein HC772_15010, partial [Leptolyngbyaceae cyanobacterium CRU_2_3]|nr:hypothetical protein [Leptolyngbyaceae cyanobacterium CRU_2_3]